MLLSVSPVILYPLTFLQIIAAFYNYAQNCGDIYSIMRHECSIIAAIILVSPNILAACCIIMQKSAAIYPPLSNGKSDIRYDNGTIYRRDFLQHFA